MRDILEDLIDRRLGVGRFAPGAATGTGTGTGILEPPLRPDSGIESLIDRHLARRQAATGDDTLERLIDRRLARNAGNDPGLRARLERAARGDMGTFRREPGDETGRGATEAGGWDIPIIESEVKMRNQRFGASLDENRMAMPRFGDDILGEDDGGRLTAIDSIRKTLNQPVRMVPFVSGAADLDHMSELYHAATRMEAGKATPADIEMLSSFSAEADRERSIGYMVGEILTQLPAFAGEFLLTGGAATGIREGGKKVGREAVEGLINKSVRDAASRAAASRAGGLALKGADATLATAIQSGLMPHRVVAEGLRRMNPVIGENEGFTEAMVKGYGDVFIEVGSEAVGGTLGKLGGGLLSKLPVPERLAALRAGVVSRWLGTGTGRTLEKFNQRLAEVGYDGILQEMAEERIGEVARGVTGIQEYQLPTLDQIAAEGIAFTVPGAMGHIAARTAGRGGQADPDGQGTRDSTDALDYFTRRIDPERAALIVAEADAGGGKLSRRAMARALGDDPRAKEIRTDAERTALVESAREAARPVDAAEIPEDLELRPRSEIETLARRAGVSRDEINSRSRPQIARMIREKTGTSPIEIPEDVFEFSGQQDGRIEELARRFGIDEKEIRTSYPERLAQMVTDKAAQAGIPTGHIRVPESARRQREASAGGGPRANRVSGLMENITSKGSKKITVPRKLAAGELNEFLTAIGGGFNEKTGKLTGRAARFFALEEDTQTVADMAGMKTRVQNRGLGQLIHELHDAGIPVDPTMDGDEIAVAEALSSYGNGLVYTHLRDYTPESDTDRYAERARAKLEEHKEKKYLPLDIREFEELKAYAENRKPGDVEVNADKLTDGTEIEIAGELFTVRTERESGRIFLEDGVRVEVDPEDVIRADEPPKIAPEDDADLDDSFDPSQFGGSVVGRNARFTSFKDDPPPMKELERIARDSGMTSREINGHSKKTLAAELDRRAEQGELDIEAFNPGGRSRRPKEHPEMDLPSGTDAESRTAAPRAPGLSQGEFIPPPPVETRPDTSLPLSAEDVVGNKNVQRLSDIVTDLEKLMDRPIRVGGFRGPKTLKGQFNVKEELVRLRKANDIPSAAHETAHMLERIHRAKLGGMTRERWLETMPPEVRRELADMDYDRAQRREYEGFAEFMRHRLTRRDTAQMAPATEAWFVKTFDAELLKGLDKVAEKIRVYEGQGSIKRMEGFINPDGVIKQKGGAKEWFEAKRKGAMNLFTDNLASLELAEREIMDGKLAEGANSPTALARMVSLTAGARAKSWVQDGVTDFAGNLRSRGLNEIFKDVKGDEKSAITLAVALRAKELHGRNIEPGVTLEDANHVIDTLSTPERIRFAREVTDWNNAALEYLLDAGGITQEAFDAATLSNQFYVPFQRVFDESDARAGSAGAGGGSAQPVKRIKGSGREIKDPVEAMMAKAQQIIGTADKVRVARALADLADSRQGMGRFVSKIPEAMVPTEFRMESVKAQLKRAGADLADADMDRMLTVFSAAKPTGFNVVPVVRNGKREYYELHPDLYRVLMEIDHTTLPKLVHLVLGVPTQMIRIGATGLKPGFALVTAPMRDLPEFLIKSRGRPDEAFRAWGRGLVETINPKSELKRLFQASGGDLSMKFGLEKASLERTRREAMANTAKRKALNIVLHPLETAQNALGFTETAPRLAEFELTLRSMGWRPGQPLTEDMAVAAANRAAEVTVNFRRAGSWGRTINRMTAFYNPAVQGTLSFKRALQARPVITSLRAAALITAPALASWFMYRDDEEWQDRPAWLKFGFLNLKVGGEWMRIPFPQEAWAVAGAMPMAIFDSLYREDPKSFNEATRELRKAIVPPLVPDTIKLAYETATNHSFHRDGPIEPQALQYQAPSARVTRYTTATAKKVAEILSSGGVEVSPIKIDYLIKGATGGLLSDLIQATERQVGLGPPKEISEPSDLPLVGRLFMRDQTSRVIDEYWTELEDLEQRSATFRSLTKSGEAKRAEKYRVDPVALRRMRAAKDDMRDGWDRIRTAETREEKKCIYDRMRESARRALGQDQEPTRGIGAF